MYLIQKRSDEPNTYPNLMPPFLTQFKGQHLPDEIDENLHDKEELKRIIAKEYGDGYYLIWETGGRGIIRVHFKGQCSSFY